MQCDRKIFILFKCTHTNGSLHVTVYLKFRSSPLLQFVLSHSWVKLISVLVQDPNPIGVLCKTCGVPAKLHKLCYSLLYGSWDQQWRVSQATGPTALWVQQPSERHGCVFKLTQTGDWAVGKCFSLSLQLLQESYWHPEIFYNACSLYGLLQKSYWHCHCPL